MDVATPYTVVAAEQPPRPASKAALIRESRRLERQALTQGAEIVAATLQDVRYLTPRTRNAYAGLAKAGIRVVLFARDLPAYVAEGVRGVALEDDDPLVDIWSVVVVSPNAPAALAAVDLHGAVEPDLDRPFSAAVSHDPEVVAACARALGADRLTLPH